MKRISCLFIFLLLLNAVFGALVLEGDISTNTTLLQSNNPHQIRGYVRVMDGVTLTIEPGVDLKFENGSTLRVEGAISAEGTSEQPIVFTSITGEDYNTRIELENAESSLFQHCTMGRSNAPALLRIVNSATITINNTNIGTSTAGHGLYINNSSVNLNSCNISNVNGRGIEISNSSSVVNMQSLSINGCQGGIFVLPGSYPAITWGGITIQNSSSYPIMAGLHHYTNLGSLTVSNSNPMLLGIWETWINSNAVLPAKALPYVINSNLTVNNCNLTLESGVDLRFNQYGGLSVENYGSLTASGTEAQPIFFQPSRTLNWRGFSFAPNSSGTLDHCTFVGPGYPEYGSGPAISANGFNNLSISNSLVPGGSNNGIEVSGSNAGNLNLINVLIQNCPGTGLYITNSSLVLDYSNLSISGCGRALALPANLIDFLDQQPNFSDNTNSNINIHSDGYISRNTTFRNWGYPYVSEALNLNASNIDLVIQPGCEFRLGYDVGIYCNGTVSAVGTATQPILFNRLSDSAPNWRGIYLDANISSAVFDYCILDHSAAFGEYNHVGAAFHLYRADVVTISNTQISNAACRGIFVESNGGSDDLTINNVTINSCGWEGVLQWDTSYNISITGLTINNCNSYPLSISANWLHQVSGLNFTNNIPNWIRILNGGSFASQTLNHGYPYLISGYNPYIYSNLSLAPGTIMYFEENCSLNVYGTLTANGTETQQVIFDRTPGSSYFWQSIYLENGSSGIFNWSQFLNCGEHNEYGYDNAFFENKGANLLSLQNCLISNVDAQAISCYSSYTGDSVVLNNVLINACRTDGIVALDDDLSINATNLTISNCLRDPLNIYPGFAGNFPGLVLSGNTNNNILLSGNANVGTVSFPNYGYVYRCNVDLAINGGSTATIGAGAVFWMQDNSYIDVWGGIAAQGTTAQPIIFTRYPESTGYWRGIKFRNNSWSNLNYCNFLWAGAEDVYHDRLAVLCQGASTLVLNNCLIKNSFGHGMVVKETASSDILTVTNLRVEDTAWSAYTCDTGYHEMTVNGLVIQNTGDFPIYSNPNLLDKFSGVSISGAGNPHIGVPAGYQERSATWPNFGLPFRMTQFLYVYDGVTLNLPAGSTLIFPNYLLYSYDPHVTVYGILNTLGTADAPVTFRGLDPAIASTWNGLRFISPDGPCNLNYTNILNAGLDEQHSPSQDYCALYVNNGTVNLNNCQLNLSNHYLVKLEGNNTVTFTGCQLTNADHGIIQNAGTLNLVNNTISNHTGSGILHYGGNLNFGNSAAQWNKVYGNGVNLNNQTANPKNAPFTYWGSTDPSVIDASIRDNEEGGGIVNFEPWFDADCLNLYYLTLDIPLGVNLNRQADTVIRLSWSSVLNANSYRVEWAGSPYANTWNEQQAGITALYLDINIPAGQPKRFYRVRAVR